MASAPHPPTVQELIEDAIGRLETLAEPQIPLEDSCPICLNSFMSIVKDTTSGDSKADPIGLAETSSPSLGVTRLQPCGHVFCKLEYVERTRMCVPMLTALFSQYGGMDTWRGIQHFMH